MPTRYFCVFYFQTFMRSVSLQNLSSSFMRINIAFKNLSKRKTQCSSTIFMKIVFSSVDLSIFSVTLTVPLPYRYRTVSHGSAFLSVLQRSLPFLSVSKRFTPFIFIFKHYLVIFEAKNLMRYILKFFIFDIVQKLSLERK